MRIWGSAVALLLSWAMVAQAEPLNLKQIPDDAKWLAHFNVDAMRGSTVVQAFYHQCVERVKDAEWETDLEQIAALTGGVTKTVDTWLDATLTEQRWAYLDQDAIVILETITNGLPFGLASIDSSEMPNGDWPSEHSME